MNWDFRPVDGLPAQPARKGRLYSAAGSSPAQPTLLFIHGAFHGAWCWSRYITFFAGKGIGAAAVDLRGHGALTQDSSFAAQGIADMAEDAFAAARALSDDVILVGHSFGALVAMLVASQLTPKALVLLAPALPGGIEDQRTLPPFAPDTPVAPPPEARALKWFLQGFEGEIAPYLSRLRPESPTLLNGNGALRVELPAIPRLCVSGSLDRSVFHPAGQDQAVARFLGAHSAIIPGGSHCFMLDAHWQESAVAILDWLTRVDALSGP